MRNAKRDANEREIIDALRAEFGDISILQLDQFDLAIGLDDRNIFLEIKNGKQKLSAAQLLFHLTWRGENYAVNNARDAIRAVRGELMPPHLHPWWEVGQPFVGADDNVYFVIGCKWLLGEWRYLLDIDGGEPVPHTRTSLLEWYNEDTP